MAKHVKIACGDTDERNLEDDVRQALELLQQGDVNRVRIRYTEVGDDGEGFTVFILLNQESTYPDSVSRFWRLINTTRLMPECGKIMADLMLMIR